MRRYRDDDVFRTLVQVWVSRNAGYKVDTDPWVWCDEDGTLCAVWYAYIRSDGATVQHYGSGCDRLKSQAFVNALHNFSRGRTVDIEEMIHEAHSLLQKDELDNTTDNVEDNAPHNRRRL